MITTTLNEIRKHHPCKWGWAILLKYLGKTQEDDEPLAFTTILDSNGFHDCCWAMSCRPDLDSLWRHFAVDCAERVRHLMTDERSINALIVARRHALGQATDDELDAARDAAWDTEWVADDALDALEDEHEWRVERAWQEKRLRHLLTTGEWTPVQEDAQ